MLKNTVVTGFSALTTIYLLGGEHYECKTNSGVANVPMRRHLDDDGNGAVGPRSHA